MMLSRVGGLAGGMRGWGVDQGHGWEVDGVAQSKQRKAATTYFCRPGMSTFGFRDLERWRFSALSGW